MQSDRARYHGYMKKLLESTDNLFLKQAEIVAIKRDEHGVCAVETRCV